MSSAADIIRAYQRIATKFDALVARLETGAKPPAEPQDARSPHGAPSQHFAAPTPPVAPPPTQEQQ